MTLERDQLLAEMGLGPRWVRRERPAVARSEQRPAVCVAAPLGEPPAALARTLEAVREPAARADSESELGATDRATLPDAERAARVSQFDWAALRQSVAECRACALCATRKQAVPGVGDENADWLFIGEGPGAEEDALGEPFVGPAGKLLDAMLAAIDLERGSDVYITNVVKCRPPGNRTPEAAEASACAPYLKRQIELLKPRLIVLLGRAAVHSLLGEDGALAGLRGKALAYRAGDREIPVVVTYHPAYLLRSLPDKAKSWEDLCRARALMRSAKAAAAPDVAP